MLSAVRSCRPTGSRASLRGFNDHLAKGLYARVCGMRPATLAQLQEYIDNDREEFYLDGPNDVDWIFRNQVTQGREGMFYVDYVAHDDGHRWSDPAVFDDILFSSPAMPDAVRMALNMSSVAGISTEALAVVAAIWRARVPGPETHCTEIREINHLTLQTLDEHGLLREHPNEVYSWIVREWQFPIYDLDLISIPVDLQVLCKRRESWCPDWY